MLSFRQRLALFSVLALPTCVAMASCSGTSRPAAQKPPRAAMTGTTLPGTCVLKGKVTHAGRPVPAGRLLFYYPTGPVPVPAVIRPDGTYVAYQLPPGAARVAVVLDPNGTPPGLKPTPWAAGKAGWEMVSASLPSGQGPGSTGSSDQKNRVLARRTPVTKLVPQLMSFPVPAGDLPTLRRLHKKYVSPFGNDSPKVEIRTGSNTFDIVLR